MYVHRNYLFSDGWIVLTETTVPGLSSHYILYSCLNTSPLTITSLASTLSLGFVPMYYTQYNGFYLLSLLQFHFHM